MLLYLIMNTNLYYRKTGDKKVEFKNSHSHYAVFNSNSLSVIVYSVLTMCYTVSTEEAML